MSVRAATATADGAATLGVAWPDVYFTPGYGAAAAVAERAEWRLTHWRDRVLVPLLVRPVDPAGRDGVSPYGYCGVHVAPGTTPAELAAFWARAVPAWREAGLVSLFLRLSPLDPRSTAVVRAAGVVSLDPRGDTVTVPVGGGPGDVWDAMAGRSRTAVRKAERAGLTADVRPAGAEDVAAGSDFRRLYERTMRRVGGSPGYLFTDAYYRALADGVGKGLLRASVTAPDGRAVAAALVLRHADRAHYHLSGSDPAAARDGANNLLVWSILRWAAESGCDLVHLGGGRVPDDSLLAFKRSFGGRRSTFHTASVVLDPGRYADLVAARARELGRPADELAATNFFPAYRYGGSR
ncbi:lipid II:glycine glycyltransferase FemX [Micromonospora okii]|uniref:lipid II:glycine glycyltransferase FemX n=1 Tax=Micromonospora okii TaxID=1182970 RepID=UPI001E32A41C|nr:GNAT family N-acetyltransferase [Micromonospora okii]